MRLLSFCSLFILLTISALAQKPSKEQMKSDKKRYAEAQKKLNEQLSKMSPDARRMYDSMTGSVGMQQKINDANNKLSSNTANSKKGTVSNGIVPEKNTKAIATIAAMPSNANMKNYISTVGNTTLSAVLPKAKYMADDIYKRGGTDARQVILSRPDMTILEAIGAAGGVPENGKASTITVIRKIDGQPQTEIIDLSEIESIAKANTVVMPNDVIYVEPAFNASIVREVAPILSAFSSIVLIYVSLVNLNR